jgi:hypothetical protein
MQPRPTGRTEMSVCPRVIRASRMVFLLRRPSGGDGLADEHEMAFALCVSSGLLPLEL